MEPIVAPLHVHWQLGGNPAAKTFPTGTLVAIRDGNKAYPLSEEGRDYKLDVVGDHKDCIGNYVQPPNVRDASRGTTDVILLKPEENVRNLVILADPAMVGGSRAEQIPGTKDYQTTTHISAAVGGVVEMYYGPHVSPNLKWGGNMTRENGRAVAGGNVYLTD